MCVCCASRWSASSDSSPCRPAIWAPGELEVAALAPVVQQTQPTLDIVADVILDAEVGLDCGSSG
jgi:hypothetical protein